MRLSRFRTVLWCSRVWRWTHDFSLICVNFCKQIVLHWCRFKCVKIKVAWYICWYSAWLLFRSCLLIRLLRIWRRINEVTCRRISHCPWTPVSFRTSHSRIVSIGISPPQVPVVPMASTGRLLKFSSPKILLMLVRFWIGRGCPWKQSYVRCPALLK